MNAIEFLKSKYIKGEEKNWKPESLEAMASFMDAYAKHQNKELQMFEKTMFENMQYYMEYCRLNEYVTPHEWVEKYK